LPPLLASGGTRWRRVASRTAQYCERSPRSFVSSFLRVTVQTQNAFLPLRFLQSSNYEPDRRGLLPRRLEWRRKVLLRARRRRLSVLTIPVTVFELLLCFKHARVSLTRSLLLCWMAVPVKRGFETITYSCSFYQLFDRGPVLKNCISSSFPFFKH